MFFKFKYVLLHLTIDFKNRCGNCHKYLNSSSLKFATNPFYFWTIGIIGTAPYEITIVHLSVRLSVVCLSFRPSVGPSLNFFKIRSLVFSCILHDYSWLLKPDFWKKKKYGGPDLCLIGLNQVQNKVFRHFL